MSQLNDIIRCIGFLGAGNMAGAIIHGAIQRGGLSPDRVVAFDIDSAKLDQLRQELGIRPAAHACAVFEAADVVVLAVKPQQLERVLDEIAPAIQERHLLISIAAGFTIARMADRLPLAARVVRVMPNTPALVGAGAAGVAPGPHATRDDVSVALALFESVGIAIETTEDQLDAVTALSGSGPAYIFRVIELMQQAGEELGLRPDVARQLTLQTVLGAARLAVESGVDPAELRRRVTSPGGTTAAALDVFEARGLPAIFSEAMHAARRRAIELSGG